MSDNRDKIECRVYKVKTKRRVAKVKSVSDS